MNWLSSISVTAKLALLVGIALGSLLAVTGGAMWALDRADRATMGLVDHELAAVSHLGRARATVGNLRRYEKDMFLNIGDDEAVASYHKKWRAEADAGESLMRESLPLLNADEAPQVETMLVGLAAYRKGVDSIIDGITTGKLHDPWAANGAMKPLKGDVRAMDLALDGLVAAVDSRVQALRVEVVAQARQQQLAGIAALVFSTSLLAALAWAIGRAITRPLAAAVKALGQVADGDLSHRITVAGQDEIAQMMRRLADMQHALRQQVADIRASADGVATASSQIADGNLDLSSRTEQQAASLQQASASMSELAGTVRQSADTALQADKLAAQASVVAARGGEIVGQVVSTMDEIQASSQRIADIIAVIDGIAFQTNILALNAAVEAARAGEQGRGFAVVAAEVRTLASRSAGAAREIKSLIAASVERVDSGHAAVADAGRTMGDIVAQVQQVTALIAQLSQSASEQSRGIDQVGRAVQQLDTATQQNAALVEQSAAAADSLKGQAARLVGSTAAFRLA